MPSYFGSDYEEDYKSGKAAAKAKAAAAAAKAKA